MTHDYRLAREKMVKNQLMPRGIADKGVLHMVMNPTTIMARTEIITL